ncbi:MAG: folate-binding protein [Paracoccaceae bacterium]|nr:folate-binding protein [Paracoccaceae bacterium]
MSGSRGFVDDRRSVLRMMGTDARAVLQNVVTNDVDEVRPGQAVYAALLTPQGKFLFDFMLIAAAGGAILIDVASDRAEALAQRLKMYCLRRDARLEGASGFGVGLILGAASPGPGMIEDIVVIDPRDPALGWRVYSEDPAAALAALGIEPADRADYDALRVAHMVPETGIELVPDETYILEAGFAALNGVDFRKGCYVGQEVTARMHHKTELKKRLVRVRVEGTAPPGTPITAQGRPAGTLFTQADGQALAHLRLDRAKGPLEAGDARVIYDG